MDLYILNDEFKRDQFVESFESMIWTERYSAYGDFEMIIDPGSAEQALFSTGTRLSIDKSDRIMVVDTTEKTDDAEGVQKLKVTGKEISEILTGRPNRQGLTGDASLDLTGEPADLVRDIFDAVCITNVPAPPDVLPVTIIANTTSIPEPPDPVTIRVDLEPLYDTLKKICEIYYLGFRIFKDGDTGDLYFEVYTGDDRTSFQTDFPAVVFSPQLDNLTDTTELYSTALLKNVAYVRAPNGARGVYANGADAGTSGFDRRVMFVIADDIDEAAGAPLQALLEQRGQEALAAQRVVIAFDGEISQTDYIYRQDYNLGDLVEKRNDQGTSVIMRVTEQIFVSDASGEKSYPTLVVDLVVDSGSWLSYGAEEWPDTDPLEWEDA